MNKFFTNSIRLSIFLTGMLMLSVFSQSNAQTPLSGTYTIDSATVTGGTNFQSFTDFADSLDANGVSGAITVNVVVGSGPYNEQIELPDASGASVTNTITINGNGEKIWTDANEAVVTLNGASYYTISNLAIEHQGTGSATRCIRFHNEADYNTIKGCDLTITKYNGTSSSSAYIMFTASATGRSAGMHGSYNKIDGNKMSGGGNTDKGPYYGVAYYGGSTGISTANEFINNDVQQYYYYGLYSFYGEDLIINDNKVHDARSDARNVCAIFVSAVSTSSSGKCQINDNEIYDNSGTGTVWGWYSTGSDGGTNQFEYMNNDIHGNSSTGTYTNVYGMYKNRGSNGIIEGNQVYDNEASFGSFYGLYTYFCTSDDIIGNAIYENTQDGYQWGTLAGIYHYYSYGKIQNNVIVANDAYGYFYGYWQGYQINGDIEFSHNTIEVGLTPYYAYAIYIYAWQAPTQDVEVVNNIIEMSATRATRLYAINAGNVYGDYLTAENNIIHENTTITVYHGDFNNTSLATFNTTLNTTSNIDVDPMFGTGTVIPSNPAIANYGLPGYATHDIFGTSRTACGPDVGVAEFYLDHSVSNLVFTGTKECSGYSEEVKFDLTNGSSQELLGMEVYYSIDGGAPVVEQIDTIKGGATKSYTFKSIPTFNGNGNMTLEVGLLCDDNDANNTLTHVIDITPAPHSFELSQGATFNGYWESGSMASPDVTVPSQVIEYNVENPAKYVNGSSDWSLVAFAMTDNGTSTTGTTLTAHTTGNKAVLAYDPDPAMADSMVFLGLTVTDNTTGCDSTFGRWVYVPHTPAVDFSADDGCDGDVVAFVNNTTQGTGATEYIWDFGDPASGAENNTSTISDPVHRFSTYGTYTIKMVAWNFDYPKFTYDISKTVNISPVPSTDFTVKNACEGINIEFTNGTTLPAGITGTIDYVWSFGDGSATTTVKDPKHTYANPGGYEVTLTASLKGCASTITKNANQFATPVADFTVDGKCNLEDVQFNNASTIALGNAGYAWTFNDGSVSNLSNPAHAFDMPGDHTVKLKAISEFGCEDEVEKTFTLNESPKADFDFTDPCSETEIEFTRTGSLPDPGTITSIFEWDFDGERISTRENDKHKFASVGVKTVTLKVSSDNFCSDEITKEFVVKLQAKADFIANDVCDGEEVVFTNKSEVAAGNLDYVWRFADGTGSNLTSPRHAYTLPTPGVTENYQVTLLALVPGGCSDSIAKTVTVNAKADPSFTASTNGRALTVTPTTNDPSYGYNWRFGDGGRSNDVTPTYRYKVDVDSFEVCLAIINTAGCISEHCEKVSVDLVGLNDLEAQDIFNVYPNPNAGVFNVTVNDPANNLNIVIMDATGKTIKTVDTDASGTYTVDISDVAAGVYMVQVINGNYSAMQRVTVAK